MTDGSGRVVDADGHVLEPADTWVRYLELHITDVGREALHAARERVEPVDRRVIETFSPKELALFRTLVTRFIQAVAESGTMSASTTMQP